MTRKNTKNASSAKKWLSEEFQGFYTDTAVKVASSLAKNSPLKTGTSLFNWELGDKKTGSYQIIQSNRAAVSSSLIDKFRKQAAELAKKQRSGVFSNVVPYTKYQNNGTKDKSGDQVLPALLFAEGALVDASKG